MRNSTAEGIQLLSSGVALVPCARVQKYFAPPPTKTIKRKWHKSAEAKAKRLLLLFLFFFGNELALLLTRAEKAMIAGWE